MPGVKHKLAEVVSQATLVEVESFLRSVFSSVVDSDADGSGERGAKADSLDLSESESSTESGPVAVPNSLALDFGPKLVEGSGRHGDSFGPSGLKSSILATSLVEPDLDVALPVLSEVDVGEDIVMLHHLSQL